MKSIIKIFFVFLLILFVPEINFAQEERSALQISGLPQLYLDALSFASGVPNLSRLDVYIEVPYEALHFAKEQDIFRAAYDVTVDVHDSTNNLVTEKFWTEKIETRDYDESVSPHASKLGQKSFSLSAGMYMITVRIRDIETQKTVQVKRQIKVRDFTKALLSISDIMLVNRLNMELDKKIIYPNISGNVADLKEGFYIFFEIYNHLGVDSACVLVTIRNIKGDIVWRDSSMQLAKSEKTSTFIKINNTHLTAGDYILDVQTVPINLTREKSFQDIFASITRSFTMRWRDLPVSAADLDLAIDQLQYITDKDQIDSMKKASPEKRGDMFNQFWKKKDPTPNTERNELMEEYYNRVAYVNKHFGHYVDGWKTDMGMVYIIFGSPSNIERHPFEIDSKPYEVWTYYDLNREFVFIDATGFGDYRLQTPIWDLWQTRPH